MSLSIGGVTSKVVEFALDGLSLRHDAIAANIANVNTPGYRPVQVSFEDSLSVLINGLKTISPSSELSPEFSPRISYGDFGSSMTNQARLDTSTVMLNQNVLQYEALIKGLDKYVSSIALAVNDGRR